MKKTFLILLSLITLALSNVAASGPITSSLTGKFNVDNRHITYLYKKTAAGDEFVLNITGNDWQTTSWITGWGLEQGVDYFLEFELHDEGGIAGFIGEFDLSGSDHVFETNMARKLVTNDYDTAWRERITGNQSFSYGTKNAAPWYGGYDDSVFGPTANWIWHTDEYHADAAAYRVDIVSTYVEASSVPEPPAAWLMLCGIMVLASAGYQRCKPGKY